MNILFLCTGNTCRSPMAEGLLKHFIEKSNIKKIEVKSAGIMAVLGDPPTDKAVQVLKELDIDISGHISQPLSENLIKWADEIYVMTSGHRSAINELFPEYTEKVKLLKKEGIVDPYGKPEEAYRQSLKDIKEGIILIIDKIKENE